LHCDTRGCPIVGRHIDKVGRAIQVDNTRETECLTNHTIAVILGNGNGIARGIQELHIELIVGARRGREPYIDIDFIVARNARLEDIGIAQTGTDGPPSLRIIEGRIRKTNGRCRGHSLIGIEGCRRHVVTGINARSCRTGQALCTCHTCKALRTRGTCITRWTIDAVQIDIVVGRCRECTEYIREIAHCYGPCGRIVGRNRTLHTIQGIGL